MKLAAYQLRAPSNAGAAGKFFATCIAALDGLLIVMTYLVTH